MKNIALLKSLLIILALLLFIGQASASVYSTNGTTYPMIWNGTYASQNTNHMTYYSNGYDLFWNGGLLQTVWDGTYAYDMVAYPENGTAISPWAFWKVESKKVPPGTWQEEIPISNQFIKVDNNTLKRVMVLGSGGKFNITYHNEGLRIKQDLELTAGYNREYRLTYRIDSVASQDVNIETKKFTPGFFNNFTLFDVTDVQPYTVNRTYNETSLLWEGNGSYLYGWNVTASIDNTNRKMYFTLTNGQIMTAGQITFIDPSWNTNGSTTPAWQNSSYSNFALDRNTGNLILPDNVTDGLVLYHKMSGSSGITSYDMNTTSNNNGTLTNMNTGLDNGVSGWNSSGKYGNAIAFDGVNDYVNAGNATSLNIRNAITIELWMKTPTSQINKYIVSKPNVETGTNGWDINTGNATNKFRLITTGTTPSIFQVTANIYDGNFHHLVGIYNGSAQLIYIDGVLAGSQSATGTIDTNSNPLYIGRFGTAGAYFSGSIDGVRIYNRALSNDEINQTMNNTMIIADNSTHWNDFGADRQGANVMFNFTNDTNSFVDAYASTDNFTSSNVLVASNITNATWTAIPASAKNQTQYVRGVLKGNGTSTPQIIEVSIEDEAVSTGNNYNRGASQEVIITNSVEISKITEPINYSKNVLQSVSVSDNVNVIKTVQPLYYNVSLSQSIGISDNVVAITISGINCYISQPILISQNVSVSKIVAQANYSRNINQTIKFEQSIRVIKDPFIKYTFSGYVYNNLGVPLQNSRIDFNGNYGFTDATGYYEFTNITEGTYSVLARAISYQNSTTTAALTTGTIINFTLIEKSWATSKETSSAGAMGFIGGIIGGCMAVGIIRRLFKKR